MDWFYIGHYGQLGPLTREQIDDLIEGGVIAPETYVWHTGMSQWLPAKTVPELMSSFQRLTVSAPPPPPMLSMQPPTIGTSLNYGTYSPSPPAPEPFNRIAPWPSLQSDRNRVLAGVLQIVIPGAGRMYLGYVAYGVLQLLACICSFGVLYLWSLIDGLVILSGGLKTDGYGRKLPD